MAQQQTDPPPPKAGDRDKPGDGRIAAFQAELVALALLDKATGQFDPATTTALKRFQWYVTARRWRLRVPPGAAAGTGVVEPYAGNPAVMETGAYDPATAAELTGWATAGVRPTTMLVRLDITPFANLQLAAGFTHLVYPGARDNEVLVSDAFTGGVGAIDTAAGANKITVRVNQTFRVQGAAPRGAVVAPARKSQHYIGHALDGNFVDGTNVATAAIMLANKQTKATQDFIDAVKKAGLRWGGDFGTRDPIHFDLPVDAESKPYAMQVFFCQRAYADGHPMRTA